MKDLLMKAFSRGPSSVREYEPTHEKDGFDGEFGPDATHDEDPKLSEGHFAAAREMHDCMQSGDHEGMAKAMHHFIKMSSK